MQPYKRLHTIYFSSILKISSRSSSDVSFLSLGLSIKGLSIGITSSSSPATDTSSPYPAAITVIVISSFISSLNAVPKMNSTSSAAVSVIIFVAVSTSDAIMSSDIVILISRRLAPEIDVSSSGLDITAFAASAALSLPEPCPIAWSLWTRAWCSRMRHRPSSSAIPNTSAPASSSRVISRTSNRPQTLTWQGRSGGAALVITIERMSWPRFGASLRMRMILPV